MGCPVIVVVSPLLVDMDKKNGKMVNKMEKNAIRVCKSWERQVIEYFEDLEILRHDYRRSVLRYPGKLIRLLHEELIDRFEYDVLNKALLKVSAALGELPGAVKEIK
jgi:hypothetical protein